MQNSNENKHTALNFLNMVVKGEIDKAYEKYVDMSGQHHNIYFPAGFTSLRDAMKENHKEFPNKKFITKSTICEDDMVAVHSKVILDPDDPGIAVVHLFRFENGKIVEMWDCGMVLPKEMPNNDGAF